MDPLSDSVFSCIFADPSTTVAMLEIINAVLTDAGDEPIQAITEMNSQYSVLGERIGARGGRLDIRAVAEDGALFDIEVQLSGQLYMNDRSWFYGSRLLSEAFREGEDYRNMPRVRVINLLDFVLREDHPDYLQPIGLMYKKAPASVASDAFRVYNIELPKFRAGYQTLESAKDDPLTRWLYLLEQGYKDENEMEVLTNMTEGMRAFAKKYHRSLDDPKLRDLYELDLSARRDQAAIAQSAEEKGRKEGRAEGRKEGRAEGRKEGRQEERAEVIRGMLVNGIPVELIYRCVDAPRAEVDELIRRLRAERSEG